MAATVLRVAFTALDTHLVFVTYYPAVLICSVLAGWRYGLLSAILAGIIAETYFAIPYGALVADASTVINLILFMSSCLLIIATGDTLRRSVRELEKTNRLADNLNRELHHRVNNMITVVQALVSKSGEPRGVRRNIEFATTSVGDSAPIAGSASAADLHPARDHRRGVQTLLLERQH
jgi:K+-sensing histidine kinase KdpD